MKDIVFLGNLDRENSILKKILNSTKYKVKKTQNVYEAEKLINRLNPDFVLCSGKIRINSEGKYFIEI